MTRQESAPSACRRKGADRRRKNTPLFSKYTFFGERRHNRRRSDRDNGYYVDRPHREMIYLVTVIGTLCLLDAFLTLYHISNGASEVNPVMDYFLTKGSSYFLLFKAFITLPGLLVLMQHQNFYYIKKIVNFIASIYLMVVIYHLALYILYC